MNLDSFTISRLIFLIFITFIAVYFIVINKKDDVHVQQPKKTVEKFTAAPPAPPAPPAPTGGSTAMLTAKQPAQNPTVEFPDGKEYVKKEELPKIVNALYKELFGQEPQQSEVDFYVEYASQRRITVDQLRDTIEASGPTLRKRLRIQAMETEVGGLGTEDEVIMVFNEILQRNPDREELYNYASMLVNDEAFNLEKLRHVLLSSEEYIRLERTQNNQVYLNLQGNITDRQLTMKVTKLHKEVTGKDYIDEDTLRFLKKKYVELDLNDTEMTKFIKAYMSNSPYSRTTLSKNTKTTTSSSSVANSTQDTAQGQTQDIETLKRTITEEVKRELATQRASSAQDTENANGSTDANLEAFADGTKTVISNSKIYIYGSDGAPSSEYIKSLGRHVNGSHPDSQSLVDDVKQQASCVFDKNRSENEMLEKNKQELSNYISDRNMSHLGTVCKRNKKYLNADDNMVLFPEFKWSVPQAFPPVCLKSGDATFNPSVEQTALIGTLLPAASDTQVGSILPVFPPV
jgi:hypothetical protein